MSPTELPVREGPERAGYVLTLAGTLVGGTFFGTIGFLLGVLYVERFMASDGLEAIPPIFIGTALGAWAGPPVMVWLFLKLAHRRAPAPTGALLVAALPAWAIVSFPSFTWMTQEMSGDSGPGRLLELLLIPILLVPPAFASRWLVLHNERVRAKREETSG